MSNYNYFNIITVDGYEFPKEPQVRFHFLSDAISLLNRGDFTIEYSFNGTHLHGDLDPDDESKGLTFDKRTESAMWFRAVDGYGTVRVEAWGSSGRRRY